MGVEIAVSHSCSLGKSLHLRLTELAPKLSRCNRATDFAPRRDVNCAYVVGMVSEPTRPTYEFALANSVVLMHEPAFGAGLAGISWLNQYERHTSKFSFILDEPSELIEPPRIIVASLGLSYNRSLTDALQILKGNGSVSAFGLHNYLLGDAMVDLGVESPFVIKQFFEMVSCAAAPDRPEPILQTPKSLIPSPERFTRVDFSIGIDSQVNLTQIDSEKTDGVIFGWWFNLTRNQHIKFSFSIDQVALVSHLLESLPLIVTNYDWNSLPSSQCGYGDQIRPSPTECSLVIGYGPLGSNPWSCISSCLVNMNGLSDCSAHKLGLHREFLFDDIVAGLVDGQAIGGFHSKGNLDNGCASSIELNHRFHERCSLFGGRIELDAHSSYHHVSYDLQDTSIYHCGG